MFRLILCKLRISFFYDTEYSGPAFEEFLECIGEKVRLKGFVKYRAQLDNKSKDGWCILWTVLIVKIEVW